MSHTNFLFAASCGSLLASRAFWASGDSATTGSAAWAADVMARKTTAAASSLMSTLLGDKTRPFYCTAVGYLLVARTAQRSFAEEARRLAKVSALVERITSLATSEYRPAR